MKTLGVLHHLGLGDFIDCNGLVRFLLKNSEFDKIYLISKANYFEMINYMYLDESSIEIVSIENLKKDWETKLKEAYDSMNGVTQEFSDSLYDNAFNSGVSTREIHLAYEAFKEKKVSSVLEVGFRNFDWNKVNIGKNCYEIFYEQVDIDSKVRKDYYKMYRDEEEELRVLNKLNPSGKPFAFIHDDEDKGYKVDLEYVNKNLKIIKNDPTENVFHFAKIIEKAEEIHCMESVYKSLVDVLNPKGKMYFHDFRGHPLGKEGEKNWKVIDYEQKFGHYSQS